MVSIVLFTKEKALVFLATNQNKLEFLSYLPVKFGAHVPHKTLGAAIILFKFFSMLVC